jgi:hypothetical protein
MNKNIHFSLKKTYLTISKRKADLLHSVRHPFVEKGYQLETLKRTGLPSRALVTRVVETTLHLSVSLSGSLRCSSFRHEHDETHSSSDGIGS